VHVDNAADLVVRVGTHLGHGIAVASDGKSPDVCAIHYHVTLTRDWVTDQRKPRLRAYLRVDRTCTVTLLYVFLNILI
jgi:hypothetical protein